MPDAVQRGAVPRTCTPPTLTTMADIESGNRMLARVASILDAAEGEPVTASELARRCGLSVSTTHRLALAMVEVGLLRRDSSGVFELGERFRRSALAAAALPVLEALRDQTGETVQLWIRAGNDRVCIASADGTQELRAIVDEGSRFPLPAGSAGGILAATDEATAQLDRDGWVESVGRRTPGLGSVSAPVRANGDVIAAVCLPLPISRVHESPGADLGDQVRAAAHEITTRIVPPTT